MSIPRNSILAATTLPAVVYLGLLMKSRYEQNCNKNIHIYNYNNNNSNIFTIPQQSLNSFHSELQDKLHKVQRSRLDPIEEEREYWH